MTENNSATIGFEKQIWGAANVLRGNMDASEYKQVEDVMEKETINSIIEFRDSRNWKQYHNPKDLAISLNLEASELLEIFQWSGNDLECSSKIDKLKDELADVLIYCVLLSDAYKLNIDEIIREKIAKNNQKYPVKLAYGSSLKYDELNAIESEGK